MLTSGSTAPELIKAGVAKEKIVSFDDIPTMWIALEQGRVDAIMHSNVGGVLYLKKTGSKDVEMAEPWTPIPSLVSNVTWYFRPSDDTLRAAVDNALAIMKRDGTVGQLLNKWGIGAQFMVK